MPAQVLERVAANLASIRTRIEAACWRCGRSPESIQLVAVTKYAPIEAVQALVQLGPAVLGESRPQQLLERSREVPGAQWHLIGHLQRNKVRPLLPHVALIHSVDSLRLLDRINEVGGDLQMRPRLLLEVNVSGEPTKDGFSPAGLKAVWDEVAEFTSVDVCGLMTMAPVTVDPEQVRPVFAELRRLRDELQQAPPQLDLPELSMGMSGDFEVAIEEGATLVRIGSLLFEGCEELDS